MDSFKILQTFKSQREKWIKNASDNRISALSKGSIWNELSEQHRHQSMDKYHTRLYGLALNERIAQLLKLIFTDLELRLLK